MSRCFAVRFRFDRRWPQDGRDHIPNPYIRRGRRETYPESGSQSENYRPYQRLFYPN